MSVDILFRSIAIKNEQGDKFIVLSEVGNNRTFDIWNKIARSWQQDSFCHTIENKRWATREEILDNVASADNAFDSGSYRLVGRRSGTSKADFLRTYKRALNHAKTFDELAAIGLVFTFQTRPQDQKFVVDSDATYHLAISQAKALGHSGGYLTHYGFGDRDFERIIPTKKRSAVKGEVKNPVVICFNGWQYVTKITSKNMHHSQHKDYAKVYEKSYATKLLPKLQKSFGKLEFEIIPK